MPLRILHLNSLLRGGGTDDQCVRLAHGLHQLGEEVAIAGPGGREFSSVIQSLGVPFFDTGENASKMQFVFRAARLLRQQKAQIVHGHHGRDLWRTVLAARLSGVKPKIILTRHMAKSPSSWLSRRFLLNQCDAMIAVSEFVARVLRDGVYEPDSPEEERRARPPLHGDHSKIHVIHGGIDTRRFRPLAAVEQRRAWNLDPEHFAFGVVGGYSLPRGKGQREFLRAAARVYQQIPNARFLIVGRGDMAAQLTEDIQNLGLSGKASLTPYCHDMPLAMNALDCLVHPQVGTEALGLVVCEAHACGRPVIASALDGIPEAFVAGNYGTLVAPESIDELAAAMLDWAMRPRPTEIFREEMHAKVSEAFSIEKASAKMQKFYRQLVPA